MTRRLVAGPLWFVAVSSLVTFVETLFGQPRQFGAIFGIATAAFVMLDPMNFVWSARNGLLDRTGGHVLGVDRAR
jgi:hypothetical protein